MAVVGFRRTLVGLKQQRQGRQSDQRHLFQTDPCGIEADGPHVGTASTELVSDGPLWD